MKNDEDKAEDELSKIGKFLISFTLSFAKMTLCGYVTMYLWNGLVVPTFGLITLGSIMLMKLAYWLIDTLNLLVANIVKWRTMTFQCY